MDINVTGPDGVTRAWTQDPSTEQEDGYQAGLMGMGVDSMPEYELPIQSEAWLAGWSMGAAVAALCNPEAQVEVRSYAELEDLPSGEVTPEKKVSWWDWFMSRPLSRTEHTIILLGAVIGFFLLFPFLPFLKLWGRATRRGHD